jgi:hypothetical protein
MKFRFGLPLSICLLWVAVSTAPAATIFRYSAYPGGGRDLPTIFDSGGAGNNGTADPSVKFEDDVPGEGVPTDAGIRAPKGNGAGGILTSGTSELLNSAIAAAGGFTMETWFYWHGGGTINALIDYAGAEKLVYDTTQPAGSQLRMRVNDDPALDCVIGSVQPEQWHYVASVFDTQGNVLNDGSISGVFRLYMDGNMVTTTDTMTISGLGDSRDLGIGVMRNPLNLDENFDGLVFEPRVTLGALSRGDMLYVVPEPSGVLLLTVGLLVSLRMMCGGCRTR